ncbi:unnamed protein product [marine sediment metagenome]|uniref:Uncharacterized protein n=1 Tax=marine sediment metagenome TaxID=412755 RepID=X1KGU3_9ZZZZ
MVTITAKKEDYQTIVKVAGRMQMLLKRKVSLGEAAGHACNHLLSDTKMLEASLRKKMENTPGCDYCSEE